MSRHGSLEISVILRGLATAVICATCLAPCGANDSVPRRSRSLLPPLPPPPKTREELFRAWDLNADGKIDVGEAELAASRMRLERADLRLNSGFDPVTGLPRGESAEQLESDPPADEAAPPEEPPDAAEADREESPALPGTRVPRSQPRDGVGRDAGPDGASRQPATPGGRPGVDASRRPVTGGVRGGGMAARSGYGSDLPAGSLNAGLPIPPRTRPTGRPGSRPAGGLVPVPRQTPAPTRPAAPPRTARPPGPYDPY